MIGRIEGRVGEPVTMSGYVQDYESPVESVLISGDGGNTWSSYPTEHTEAGVNVNWRFAFTPTSPGLHRVLIKAKTADGRITPEPAYVEMLIERSYALA